MKIEDLKVGENYYDAAFPNSYLIYEGKSGVKYRFSKYHHQESTNLGVMFYESIVVERLKKYTPLNNEQKYLQTIKELETKVAELEAQSNSVPLAPFILQQEPNQYGHVEFTIPQITLVKTMELCKELSDNINQTEDIFHLALFNEDGGHYSGSIYQCCGIKAGEDKLWVSFDKIVLGE